MKKRLTPLDRVKAMERQKDFDNRIYSIILAVIALGCVLGGVLR